VDEKKWVWYDVVVSGVTSRCNAIYHVLDLVQQKAMIVEQVGEAVQKIYDQWDTNSITKKTKEKQYHEQGHFGGFSKNIRKKETLLNNRILRSETCNIRLPIFDASISAVFCSFYIYRNWFILIGITES